MLHKPVARSKSRPDVRCFQLRVIKDVARNVHQIPRVLVLTISAHAHGGYFPSDHSKIDIRITELSGGKMPDAGRI